MAFGERLQELRRARGMTQEDFAAQLKVSRQAVSKWESCRGYPELEKIIYICNRYGVTMNDLFCEEVPLGGQETPAAPERMESRTLKTALGDFVSNLSPANKWAGVGGLAAVTALVALCMLYLKGGGDSEMTALWIAAIVVFGVVEAVTCRAASAHPAEGEERFRVSLLDYGAKRNIARELCRRGCAIAENEILKHKVAQHHDDLAADGAQQREAKGLFAAGAKDQRRDHGRTPFDDECAGRVAHVAGDHIRQTGAETGSHAAVERAGQQGGEYDHDVAGVEIAAGHGRDLDDERRHAAQRHEHGGVDEISEFLVHNYHLFMLLAQEYDIRHK